MEAGDKVKCMDTSGFSVLDVNEGDVYEVEALFPQCFVKLKGIEQKQKQWRFVVVGQSSNL